MSEENIHHCTAFILPNVRARRENYTLTKDPKQLLFWERFGGLQVRGTTRFEGLHVRGATRLHTTDSGSGDARTSSGGYKIRGATRFGGLQDYALRTLSPGTDELILESYKGPFNVTLFSKL